MEESLQLNPPICIKLDDLGGDRLLWGLLSLRVLAAPCLALTCERGDVL